MRIPAPRGLPLPGTYPLSSLPRLYASSHRTQDQKVNPHSTFLLRTILIFGGIGGIRGILYRT